MAGHSEAAPELNRLVVQISVDDDVTGDCCSNPVRSPGNAPSSSPGASLVAEENRYWCWWMAVNKFHFGGERALMIFRLLFGHFFNNVHIELDEDGSSSINSVLCVMIMSVLMEMDAFWFLVYIRMFVASCDTATESLSPILVLSRHADLVQILCLLYLSKFAGPTKVSFAV